jgi:[glutamine synthetase] adenylyltransferase / [glutamine synthetase]-adenylyl-L-tyrosine phosphorylase
VSERSTVEAGLVERGKFLAAFRNPAQANRSLAAIKNRCSPEISAAIPDLLSSTPDPESALVMLERFAEERGNALAESLRHEPALLHYAITIFGSSRFLGETLLRNPDLLIAANAGKELDRRYSRDDFESRLRAYRSKSGQTDISTVLAAFKRREYVRTFLRDVLRIATLGETTSEISALSDVLIEAALQEAEAALLVNYGSHANGDSIAPVSDSRFVVIALGKLGGSELNYSSDVDLMYVFRGTEPVAGTTLTAQEYFIRLAQGVTDILSRATTEGPVFRIDLRLRPRGVDGELAISLAQALHYYTRTAQDWELQALIKARHCAGDPGITRAFVRAVQPHVYTEAINFPAIKTALVAREKMHQMRRLRAKPDGIDVKLGHGGIRDIEFLVQCLQRVYGGGEPWLRSRGTLFALQKLYDKGHLREEEFQRLSSAYEFLRHLEHRLQLRHGRQTHALPNSPDELRMLRRSMDRYFDATEMKDELPAIVKARMAAISEIYKRVILQQQIRESEQLPEFALRVGTGMAGLDATDQGILERLAMDAPSVHAIAARGDLDPVARKNLFRFLSAALTSSERYASVLRNPRAVEQALVIFEESELLTDILVRYPEELGTLSQVEISTQGPPSGYLFDQLFEDQRLLRDPVFGYLAASRSPEQEKLSLLRRHHRHRMFAEGALDLLSFRDVYDALAATTGAAEDAISCAFQMAGPTQGLAVMALGRLGTREFDLGSDADLLFVRDEGTNAAELTSTVERFVRTLAAYTQDGIVMAVDTRLRPRGQEGELIVTVPPLEAYFAREAQPWEALLYTKLRFIAGDARLGGQASQTTQSLFERFANSPQAVDAIREMRSKLEGIHEVQNFKTAPGGTYDIDFISSYLLVKHGVDKKNGTLRERVWRCAGTGLLEKRDAARLDHAAELLRTAEHVVRLVSGRSSKWLPKTEHARKAAEKLVEKMLQRPARGGLEVELIETCAEVREIYKRIFAEGISSA